VQNELEDNSLAQNGSHIAAFLILAAITVVPAYAIARRLYLISKLRNIPLKRATVPDKSGGHGSAFVRRDCGRPALPGGDPWPRRIQLDQFASELASGIGRPIGRLCSQDSDGGFRQGLLAISRKLAANYKE